jgi:hypothetical protein
MDVVAHLEAPCSPDEVMVYVEDLAQYPRWVDLVHRAAPAGGDELAWDVELRARVGPLTRSKRLRMTRAVRDERTVEFRRRELDGRRHSDWVLRAELDEVAGGTSLTMRLHYGGGLWTGGLLERALAEQITAGRSRLLELLATRH